jgi:hypothetical protein
MLTNKFKSQFANKFRIRLKLPAPDRNLKIALFFTRVKSIFVDVLMLKVPYLSDVAVSFFLERELFTKPLRRLKFMLILLHKICNNENIQINCVTDR